MEELHRKMQAIEFILGIGGAENELVPRFRKWPEERLQDYLNNLVSYLKDLQAEKIILLQQQQQPPVQRSISVNIKYKTSLQIKNVTNFDHLVSAIQTKWPDLKVMGFKILFADQDNDEGTAILDDDKLFSRNIPSVELKVVSTCIGFSDYCKDRKAALSVVRVYDDTSLSHVDNTHFCKTSMSDLLGDSVIVRRAEILQQDLTYRSQVINMAQISEYTRREFISPILIAALNLVTNVTMICEKSITGISGRGPVDYVMVYQNLNIVLTEAKKEDMEGGMYQNLVQQEASHQSKAYSYVSDDLAGMKRKSEYEKNYDILRKIPTFGIVTDATEWQFLELRRESIDSSTLTISSRYYLSFDEDAEIQLKQIIKLLGIIIDIIRIQKVNVDSNNELKTMTNRKKTTTTTTTIQTNPTNQQIEHDTSV